MLKVLIKNCLIIILMLLTFPALARVEIVRSFNDFVFGNWNGQGNLSLSQSACIRSYTGNNFFSLRARDFALRAQMNTPASSSGSPFVFYHVSNSNYSFPFVLEVSDLLSGGSQTLAPDTFSNALTYQIFLCFFGGNNAELTVSALANDMYAVPAGDYRVSMDVEARRLNNGGGVTGDRDRQNNVLGTVTIPSLVRLSNIEDINFGVYDGVSGVVSQNESFCVYSNASNYTITPSTLTSAGSPLTFGLSSAGGKILEYSVRINNSADGASGVDLTNGETSGSMSTNLPYPFSVSCRNGDNAAIFIQIQGSDIQAVSPGSYSGTLMLQVAPI
ncbi:MAG: hypothetical protein ACRBCS_02290 [Cellvibrionaceae bacterium]